MWEGNRRNFLFDIEELELLEVQREKEITELGAKKSQQRECCRDTNMPKPHHQVRTPCPETLPLAMKRESSKQETYIPAVTVLFLLTGS